jgi:hypothetical protein
MWATATLLSTGKVLIAGGSLNQGPTETLLSSAELYDPATDSFTVTGSMLEARANQTATLLQDGRVLIAGGLGCKPTGKSEECSAKDTVASAELYDSTTGKFVRTGSMSTPRASATATLLNDGRVLLADGANSVVAEVYDPGKGEFAPTGPSLVVFETSVATILRSGQVLVAGRAAGTPYAQLYDPTLGRFTELALTLPPDAAASAQYNGRSFDRSAPETATLLKDGRVLLFESGYLETYDPATGNLAPAGFLSAPGQWEDPTATVLADGRVLLEGGTFSSDPNGNGATTASSAATFDPLSGLQQVSPLTSARLFQTATLLPNGSVLVAGGTTDGQSALSSAEVFLANG